jgi:hypothetical protein
MKDLPMIRNLPVLLLSILSAFAAGCGGSARLGAPAGFAHVEGRYDDRVASPRGVVIGARAEKNDPKANLDFWAEAVDLRLRAQGWTPEETKSIKSARGLAGTSLRYARVDGARTSRYWASVFVTDARVVLVEAGGDQRDFDAAKEQVETTIASVVVD